MNEFSRKLATMMTNIAGTMITNVSSTVTLKCEVGCTPDALSEGGQVPILKIFQSQLEVADCAGKGDARQDSRPREALPS